MFDCSLKELIIPLRGIKGSFFVELKNLLKAFKDLPEAVPPANKCKREILTNVKIKRVHTKPIILTNIVGGHYE